MSENSQFELHAREAQSSLRPNMGHVNDIVLCFFDSPKKGPNGDMHHVRGSPEIQSHHSIVFSTDMDARLISNMFSIRICEKRLTSDGFTSILLE